MVSSSTPSAVLVALDNNQSEWLLLRFRKVSAFCFIGGRIPRTSQSRHWGKGKINCTCSAASPRSWSLERRNNSPESKGWSYLPSLSKPFPARWDYRLNSILVLVFIKISVASCIWPAKWLLSIYPCLFYFWKKCSALNYCLGWNLTL